jgi:hypothetical protein
MVPMETSMILATKIRRGRTNQVNISEFKKSDSIL